MPNRQPRRRWARAPHRQTRPCPPCSFTVKATPYHLFRPPFFLRGARLFRNALESLRRHLRAPYLAQNRLTTVGEVCNVPGHGRLAQLVRALASHALADDNAPREIARFPRGFLFRVRWCRGGAGLVSDRHGYKDGDSEYSSATAGQRWPSAPNSRLRS